MIITWEWRGIVHLLVARKFLRGNHNVLCGNYEDLAGIGNRLFNDMKRSHAAAIANPVDRLITCLWCAIGNDYAQRGD